MSLAVHLKKYRVFIAHFVFNAVLAQSLLFVGEISIESQSILLVILFFSTNALLFHRMVIAKGFDVTIYTFPLPFLIINLVIGLLSFFLVKYIPLSIHFAAIGTYFFVNYFTFTSILFEKGNKRLKLPSQHIPYLIVILIAVLVSAFVSQRGVSIYTTLNTDAHVHMIAIKEIFRNGNLSLFLTEINNAFTVKSYLPTFHLIFGPILSLGSPLSTVLVFNLLEKVFFATFTILLYLYTFKLTKNPFASSVVAILNLMIFEPTGAYTSFFLLPQNITIAMGILLFLAIQTGYKYSKWYLVILMGLLILTHFFVGAVLLGIVLFVNFIDSFEVSFKLLIFMSIFFIFALFMAGLANVSVYSVGSLLLSDFSDRANDVVVLQPLQYLNELFKIFGPLTLFMIWAYPYSIIKKDRRLLVLITLILAISLLMIGEFPYSTKLFNYIHYLGILVVGLTLVSHRVKHIAGTVLLLILLSFSAFHLNKTYLTYKEIFYDNGVYSLIGDSEYRASTYINRVVTKDGDEDALLVSDPLSMTLIESISKVKTTGGVWTPAEERETVWAVLNNEENISKAKSSLNINDVTVVYLILTPRTVQWANNPEEYSAGFGNEIWSVDSSLDVRRYCNKVIKEDSELRMILNQPELCVLSYSE